MTDNKHYVAERLIPQAFNKYIVIRGSETSSVINRVLTVVDVLVSLRHWRGYNIFVDWSDSKVSTDGSNVFHDCFKLKIKEQYAYSLSDIPEVIRDNAAPQNIDRDALLRGPSAVGNYSLFTYDSFFEHEYFTDDLARGSFLWNACADKVVPRWFQSKAARGYFRDKFKDSTVIGVDLNCINESNLSSFIDAVDSFVCKKINIRLFAIGSNSLYAEYIVNRYSDRLTFREHDTDPIRSELMNAIIMSLCPYVVGSNNSNFYLYAKWSADTIAVNCDE